jgi:type IV pilus assembly protein PilQ
MKRSRILNMAFGVVFLIFLTGCAAEKTLVQPPKQEASPPLVKVSTIQNISFAEEENYTKIKIEGSEPLSPPFYKLLSDPLRIAIDVPNVDLRQVKSPLIIDNGTIGDVLATQDDDKGRIEITLLQMTNYNISKEEKTLIIDVEKVKKVPETKEAKTEEEPLKETKAEAPPAEPKKEEALPTPLPVNKAKDVVNVLFEEKNDFISFNIIADGRLENYDSFKLDSPARLVVDIWGVRSKYSRKSIKVKNPLVKAVRIGQHPDKLRLVFDSSKPQKLPPYQINRIDDKLIVSLGNIPQPSEPQIYVQEKSAKEAPATTPNQPESAPKPGKPSTLTGINFKQMDDKSRIVLSLSTEETQFESSTPSTKVIVIDVKNAFAPKRLLRGLDTSAFESVVNYIDLKNVKVGKVNDIHVVVKLGEETTYETTQEGKEIFVDIKEKPKKIEAKAETPPMEVKKEEAAEVRKEEVKKEEEAKKEETPAPELKKEEMKAEEKAASPAPVPQKAEEEKKSLEGGRPGKVYTGTKLSLDFKDADIKNILRLIAEVSNLNIITADEVTGKITMRLVDVPWDQALDVILQSKNLDKRQVGNVVRIAPIDVLRREDQAKLEEQRSKERLEPLVNELIPVNYAAAKEIMPQVKSVLTERGDVKVDERTNTLIIKDISKSIPAVKNLVKSLDTKTPQVVIEARIIEASVNFQRDLGVKWGFLASTGESKNKTAYIGGGTGGTSTLPGPGTDTKTTSVVNLPATLPTGAPGAVSVLEFLFTSKYGLKQLDIAISAYENKSDVNIISSPKIATLDNKEASIEQGLRIPYTKLTTEGTATEDFIDANLKLTVTPHVTNDGHIKMTIKVKKDAPSSAFTSVFNTPSIDKKEAITEVLVKDNAVVAIGGIYSIEKDNGNVGVPLFNKIPLLGWLFKEQSKQDLRKDLLIFISPKIFKDQI